MTNPLVPRETAALVGEWGEIRKNGLILNPATPYEEWQRIYHTLESIGDGVQWWVGDCLNFGERGYGESYSQVLDPDNGNYQTVANWRWVAGQIELSRRREKLSWSHHAEVAGLEPGQQDALLLAAEEGNWPKGRLRKEAQKIKQGEKLSQPLPEGKYRIIYADPPWEYSGINLENYGPAERHYPTMATDELCELSISTLTAEDAVLFLWATSPMLPDAMRVIEAWGMEYKASIVWNKDAHNYGQKEHE